VNSVLGFSWETSAVPSFVDAGSPDRAVARFHRALPQAVWEAANFEGSPYTLPEVQTLIDGVTVGGHTLHDERLVLGLITSAKLLRATVADGSFALDKATSDRFHRIIAEGEAIEAGHFRGEGTSGGGGRVNLGAHDPYFAPDPGLQGEALLQLHAAGLEEINAVSGDDPGIAAVLYFCFATRAQFYFDGNKRTARWMMNGHLMSHGLDAIGIPVSQQLAWNQNLTRLFTAADATPLMAQMAHCQIERIQRPSDAAPQSESR